MKIKPHRVLLSHTSLSQEVNDAMTSYLESLDKYEMKEIKTMQKY